MVNILVLFRILTGGFLSTLFSGLYAERAPKISLAFFLGHFRALLSIPPTAQRESTWPGEAEEVDGGKGDPKPSFVNKHTFAKQATARRTEITVLTYE